MNKELLALYSAIHFSSSNKSTVESNKVSALTAEIGVFGYTLDGNVIERLKTLSNSEFDVLRTNLHSELKEVSGDGSNHAVLFNRFPYSTPEKHEYMERRVRGAMANLFGFESEDAGNFPVLSCGHVIDPTEFDLSEFGACPICQEQVKELDSPERDVRFDFKSVTPFKVITFADDAFITKKVTGLLVRNSSLSPIERKFILLAAPDFKPERPSEVFRETLPLVYKVFPDPEYISGLVSGATDILRIATFLSDAEADLSLKDNVKFKVSTSDKKKLLALLENRSNLAEDLMRHRNKWLALGQKIALSADVQKRFPKVALAFDQLRKNPEDIQTFSRTVEHAMRVKIVELPLLKMLAKRPAEFMRRLDFLLRTAEEKDAALSKLTAKPENVSNVMTALGDAVVETSTKLLLEIRKYLEHRAEYHGATRIFIPKGVTTKAQVREDKRGSISTQTLALAVGLIEHELKTRYNRLDKMGKVYIDPALKGMLLPFNRRGDAATNTAILKGSRYPVNPDAPVIRLFVHWTKDTDVDLSVVLLDNDFAVRGQVSYTNLNYGKMVHSGDLRSAPKGGSEFIDVDIADVLALGSRYVIMSVLSFRGLTFDNFPCYAGFMERDSIKSGQRYEPESVAVKFDISSAVTNYMPIIFDLVERTVVFADLVAGKNHSYGNVATKGNRLASLAKAVMDLPNRKLTFYDVLELNARVRGSVVEDRTQADVCFDAADIDLEETLSLTAI
jgi:hypothetical protein